MKPTIKSAINIPAPTVHQIVACLKAMDCYSCDRCNGIFPPDSPFLMLWNGGKPVVYCLDCATQEAIEAPDWWRTERNVPIIVRFVGRNRFRNTRYGNVLDCFRESFLSELVNAAR